MVQVKVSVPKVVGIRVVPTEAFQVQVQSEIVQVCDHENYKGEYAITPTFEGTTMKTKNKVMKFDVELKPIPVERVANLSGGNTIIIGG